MTPQFPQLITRDVQVFDEFRRINIANASSASTPAPVVIPGSTNATTLNGLPGSFYLDRANHTGVRYHVWDFANELSGFVLRGRENGGLFRLHVADDDPAAPQAAVEPLITVVPGDIVFAASLNGPILVGRYRGALYRFLVHDDDPPNPQLGLEFAGTAASGDFSFAHNGATFLNRSRAVDASDVLITRRWAWYVQDRDGGDLTGDNPAVEAA